MNYQQAKKAVEMFEKEYIGQDQGKLWAAIVKEATTPLGATPVSEELVLESVTLHYHQNGGLWSGCFTYNGHSHSFNDYGSKDELIISMSSSVKEKFRDERMFMRKFKELMTS